MKDLQGKTAIVTGGAQGIGGYCIVGCLSRLGFGGIHYRPQFYRRRRNDKEDDILRGLKPEDIFH